MSRRVNNLIWKAEWKGRHTHMWIYINFNKNRFGDITASELKTFRKITKQDLTFYRYVRVSLNPIPMRISGRPSPRTGRTKLFASWVQAQKRARTVFMENISRVFRPKGFWPHAEKCCIIRMYRISILKFKYTASKTSLFKNLGSLSQTTLWIMSWQLGFNCNFCWFERLKSLQLFAKKSPFCSELHENHNIIKTFPEGLPTYYITPYWGFIYASRLPCHCQNSVGATSFVLDILTTKHGLATPTPGIK